MTPKIERYNTQLNVRLTIKTLSSKIFLFLNYAYMDGGQAGMFALL